MISGRSVPSSSSDHELKTRIPPPAATIQSGRHHRPYRHMFGWLDFCLRERDDVVMDQSSSGSKPPNGRSGRRSARAFFVRVGVLVGVAMVVTGCMPCGTLGGSCGPGMSPEGWAESSAEAERRLEAAREICVPIPDSLADQDLDGITWNNVGDWGYSIDEVYLSAVRIVSPEGSHVVSVRFPIGGGQRTFALLVTGPLEFPDSLTFLPEPWPTSMNANPTTFAEAQHDMVSYYGNEYLEREYDYVQGCGSAGLETGPHQRS